VSEHEVDVVVVGMGSAGAAAARFLASSGRRVLAIDKREAGATGARWVNAVPRWCFEAATVTAPSGDELFGGVSAGPDHAFHLVAPDGKSRLALRSPPVLHVDMRRLCDRLVHEAREAGVEPWPGRVSGGQVRCDRVRALRVSTDRGETTVRTRLVVDASGIGGAIRSRVPQLARICPDPEPEHRCVAAQFQFAVRDPAGLEAFLAAQEAQLGHDVAFPGVAGGFSTLTVFSTRARDVVGVLTGSIPSIGAQDARDVLDRFVASQPWIGERLWGGRGAIPVRRPYDVLARSGVALIGDAACQVHAAHGSGVGMGLLAARALSDAASAADDPGSDAVLARYEALFQGAHGGLLAAADAFRRFVQAASAADLSALIAEGLLDERLAMDALAQRPTRPDVRLALGIAPRAARAPRLAMRFAPLAVKTGLLDRLGTLHGRARSATITRMIEGLVGPAPRSRGPGPWNEPFAPSIPVDSTPVASVPVAPPPAPPADAAGTASSEPPEAP